LQTEILDIEFNEFSKGMNKITSFEFSEILLRYTDFDRDTRLKILRRLQQNVDVHSRDISFDKFYQFNAFINNLEDFSLALKFHTQANKPINKYEFQKAVKLSSGFELNSDIVNVIYMVFDENDDGNLSYKEFLAVLKDRLSRGLKCKGKHLYEISSFLDEHSPFDKVYAGSQDSSGCGIDMEPTYFEKFKKCIKRKLHQKNYDWFFIFSI